MKRISELLDRNVRQECRIHKLSDVCEYRRYARYFVNRSMIKIKSDPTKPTTGWYKFKFEKDRKALINQTGWGEHKDVYFLQNPQLKN